jgi:hypothetical protein
MKNFVILIFPFLCAYVPAGKKEEGSDRAGMVQEMVKTLRQQVMTEAAWAMQQEPETVTATVSPRSAGGPHDFFSEADYFWPNPKSADSPYINRDGMTNPDNFVAHRYAMIRFSKVIGALASAYLLTHDTKYVAKALEHCRAWFLDSATYMYPRLLYSQAIKGRVTGRGIGIIDTIHLLEVVQGLLAMAPAIDKNVLDDIRKWFADYLQWLKTHQYSKDEMNRENNHATCWAMQVAEYARFTNDKAMLDFCRNRFEQVLLPNQMAVNGSFPLEIKRTKPYGYSIFNLDAMTMVCQILSDKKHDLWAYTTADGKGMKKGMEYLYPYLADKSAWPFEKDVMHWDNWPVAQPSLVFCALAYDRSDWLATWKRLDHQPADAEVIRNLPIRHPLIWIPELITGKIKPHA